MQQQVKQLDFSGQNIYAGIDAHKKQMTVTILSDHLSHKTFSQPPKAETLIRYLQRKFPGANYFAAYEASFCGFWLCEQLKNAGVDCIVVNAADVPTKDKERNQKRDPMDSRKIARSLRSGELDPIYVPSKKGQCDRSLIRTRSKLVGNLSRCKNRIKSFLYFYGINFPEAFLQPGTHWSKAFMNWLKKLNMEEPTGKQALNAFIAEAEHLRTLLLQITQEIRTLSMSPEYQKRVKLLMSVPGVGRITAMVILTELENILRFQSLDQLCSYVGLIPKVSSSDETERVGNITQRSNRMLRSMLIENSWIAIRKDPALTLKYNELCNRMKSNKAIIRIARKLVNRIRTVLIKEQEYQLAVVA